MKASWQKVTALAGLAAIYLLPVSAETWDGVLVNIRKRFPSVRQLSTGQLDGWIADTNGQPHPLIIDARPEAEYAVSHLRGARNCVSVGQVKAALETNTRPIVVYCSVGYRSSALAEKLQRAGLTNVWNLEGSLFAWANEGRPVYRGETLLKPVRVHPYDAKWGQLLKPELRGLRQ